MALSRRHFVTACAAALASGAHAGSAPLPVPYSFRFEWLEGGSSGPAGDGHLDLGTVAASRAAMRNGRTVLTRRVAVRIEGAGPTARLSVALATEAPGCTVRVDGLAISTIPRVVDAAHRVGAPVVHQIEITIPRNVPPGAFLSNFQWQAEPV